jgi:hypothetical protein
MGGGNSRMIFSAAIIVLGAYAPVVAQQRPSAAECTKKYTDQGYAGDALFKKVFECRTSEPLNRATVSDPKVTVPNDATLRKLQDAVTTKSQ